jgi:hypothetical protein
VQTTGYGFSNTLGINDILEIGQLLFRSLAGKDDFLTRGIIWACLK